MGIIVSSIAGYFLTTQRFTSTYQAAVGEVAARNRQIASEEFQIAGQTSGFDLLVDVSNTGPLALRVVAIFINDTWTRDLTAGPEAINVDTTETLDTLFDYTSGVVTIRVVTERGNLATQLFPPQLGATDVVIAAFDQTAGIAVDVHFNATGAVTGTFCTGITGQIFTGVTGPITVTMADNDTAAASPTCPGPKGSESFVRWADGIGSAVRTITLPGTYTAFYGLAPASTAGGIGPLSMVFQEFKHHRCTAGEPWAGGTCVTASGYGPPSGITISPGLNYFSVVVFSTETDSLLTLDNTSALWQFAFTVGADRTFPIKAYQLQGGPVSTTFPTVPLAAGQRVRVWFGPESNPLGPFKKLAADFLFFHGTITDIATSVTTPFGENLPFATTAYPP